VQYLCEPLSCKDKVAASSSSLRPAAWAAQTNVRWCNKKKQRCQSVLQVIHIVSRCYRQYSFNLKSLCTDAITCHNTGSGSMKRLTRSHETRAAGSFRYISLLPNSIYRCLNCSVQECTYCVWWHLQDGLQLSRLEFGVH
jgi:hypothetical protein